MSEPLPNPAFIGWFPWRDLTSKGISALDEAGTYLLARYSDGPPANVDVVDKSIFYVGETHGRTRCLRARLTDFGRSAGFYGKQQSGHYAAWGYPDEFPEDRPGQTTDSSRVHFALCPFPGGDLPLATRGVFPGLVESMVLWQYTHEHKTLPVLNNSGAGQEIAVRELPDLDPATLRTLLLPGNQTSAASALITKLAIALGYSPKRTITTWSEDGWTGVARHLYGRWWISIGWPPDGGEVGIWVEDGNEAWFGTSDEEAPVSTDEHLLGMIRRFWHRWHVE